MRKLKRFYSLMFIFLFLFMANINSASSQVSLECGKWNLIGINFDGVNVKTAFNLPEVESVWKWDASKGTWVAWSPNTTINKQLSFFYDTLETLNSGEGVWVKTSGCENSISLNIEGNLPNNNEVSLVKGWNLIATKGNSGVDVKTAFNLPEVESVWKWDASKGTWVAWSPNTTINKQLSFFYDTLETLNAGEGVWVKVSGDVSIKLGSISVENSGYYVYQDVEGSTPVPLAGVKVYKVDSNGLYEAVFCGASQCMTNSDGYVKIDNVEEETTLAFVLDGYSTVTYQHDPNEIINIYMTQSSESNLQNLEAPPSPPVNVGSASITKSAEEPTGVAITSPDEKVSVEFFNFNVKDDYNDYFVKLSYLPGSNFPKLDNDTNIIIPIAGMEMLLTDNNGISVFANFDDINNNDTAYGEAEIKIDSKLADFINQLITKKTGKLILYRFENGFWVPITDANPVVDLNNDVIDFGVKLKYFTYYLVAYSIDKEVTKTISIKVLNSDDNSTITGATVSLLGQKSKTDNNGVASLSVVLPSSGSVKVEAYYTNDYIPGTYFFNVEDLAKQDNITIYLEKKNIEKTLTINVADEDGSPVPFAKLKIFTFSSLGNVNYDGNYFYVGDEPGAEYNWFYRKVGNDNETLIDGETNSKIAINKILSSILNTDNPVGTFEIISKVIHANGYVEEGKIGIIELSFNAEDILNNNFQENDPDDLLTIFSDEWVFDANNYDKVNTWEICLLDNSDNVVACSDNLTEDTLVKDDLIGFLTNNSSIVYQNKDNLDNFKLSLTLYQCDFEDCPNPQEGNVIVPLTQTDNLLSIYTNVFPASSVPAVFETMTDDNGTFVFKVPKGAGDKFLPSIVLNAYKVGYKTVKGKMVSTDVENYELVLPELNKVTYTVTIVDSDNITKLIDNATVKLSDAIIDNDKLIDVTGYTDENGEIAFKGVVEGIHTLYIFKNGYEPYEAKIRVSSDYTEKTVKLNPIPQEEEGINYDNLLKPIIKITNKFIKDGKIYISAVIVDYNSDNQTYSGLARVSLDFNGQIESVDVDANGNINITKSLEDGLNTIELIAINEKGEFRTGQFSVFYRAIDEEKFILKGNVNVLNGQKLTNGTVTVFVGNQEYSADLDVNNNNSFELIIKGVSKGDNILLTVNANGEDNDTYIGEKNITLEDYEIDNIVIDVDSEQDLKLLEYINSVHDNLQIIDAEYSIDKGANFTTIDGFAELENLTNPLILIKVNLKNDIPNFTKFQAVVENSAGIKDLTNYIFDNVTGHYLIIPVTLQEGLNHFTIKAINPPTNEYSTYYDVIEFDISYIPLTVNVINYKNFTLKVADDRNMVPEKDFKILISNADTGNIIKVYSNNDICENGYLTPIKDISEDTTLLVEVYSPYYSYNQYIVDLSDNETYDGVTTVCDVDNVTYKNITLERVGVVNVEETSQEEDLDAIRESGHLDTWVEPDPICTNTSGTLIIDGWWDIDVTHLGYSVTVEYTTPDNQTDNFTIQAGTGKFRREIFIPDNLTTMPNIYNIIVTAYYDNNILDKAYYKLRIIDCGINVPEEENYQITPFHPVLNIIKLGINDNKTELTGQFPDNDSLVVNLKEACDNINVTPIQTTNGFYDFIVTGSEEGYCEGSIQLKDNTTGEILSEIPVEFEVIPNVIVKTDDVKGITGQIIGFKGYVNLPTVPSDNLTYFWDLDNDLMVDGEIDNDNTFMAIYNDDFEGDATVYVVDNTKNCLIIKGQYPVKVTKDPFGLPPQPGFDSLNMVYWNKDSNVPVPDLPVCSDVLENICSPQNPEACLTEYTCKEIGGYWYDNKCHAEPQQTDLCSENTPEYCSEDECKNLEDAVWVPYVGSCINFFNITSVDLCEAFGGIWLPFNNLCIPPVDLIDNNNLCEKLGGSWNNDTASCSFDFGECSLANPEYCINEDLCKTVGGLWNDDVGECLNPGDINDEYLCENYGGSWYNGVCYPAPVVFQAKVDLPADVDCNGDCKYVWDLDNNGMIDGILYNQNTVTGYYKDFFKGIATVYVLDSNDKCIYTQSYPVFVMGGQIPMPQVFDLVVQNTDNDTIVPNCSATPEIEDSIFKTDVNLPEGIPTDNLTYMWDLDNNGKIDGVLLNQNTVTAYYGKDFSGVATVYVVNAEGQCVWKQEFNVSVKAGDLSNPPSNVMDLVVYNPDSDIQAPKCDIGSTVLEVNLPDNIQCEDCSYLWDINNDGYIDGTFNNLNSIIAYYGSEGYSGPVKVYVIDNTNNQCVYYQEFNVNVLGGDLTTPPSTDWSTVSINYNSETHAPDSCGE